jgi:hypothetical protein
MEKRYQVFVSSTYEDLREERQEVIQALLELDCIPSGMELFPAADDDQWSLIKKVIDDCDYYMVIIGGRYGSLGPDGKSYTQMEYEYALEKGKPIVAFIHSEPGRIESSKVDKTEKGRQRLEAFRVIAKKKMVKSYTSPKELGSVVSRSIVQIIKAKPGVGWVRSNELIDGKAAQDILSLRNEIERLNRELRDVVTTSPPGAETLAQGVVNHSFQFDVTFVEKGQNWSATRTVELTWNSAFYYICPTLDLGSASDEEIKKTFTHAMRFAVPLAVKKLNEAAEHIQVLGPTAVSLQTLLLQFKALGYITKVAGDLGTPRRWKLTPLGEAKMNAVYAIKAPTTPVTNLQESKPTPKSKKRSGTSPSV